MNSQTQQALNGLKHLETIVDELKTYSDQGQHLNIPSHLSAGNCWWMAKEIENVINSCKEALQQPVQEPVAHRVLLDEAPEDTEWFYMTGDCWECFKGNEQALYTHPVAEVSHGIGVKND